MYLGSQVELAGVRFRIPLFETGQKSLQIAAGTSHV